jgi:hypothetical protein
MVENFRWTFIPSKLACYRKGASHNLLIGMVMMNVRGRACAQDLVVVGLSGFFLLFTYDSVVEVGIIDPARLGS